MFNISVSGTSDTPSQVPKQYVPITDVQMNNRVQGQKIIPSKTLVINELNVNITQNFDDPFSVRIDTKPGILSDNKTIPKLDITAKEDIDFSEVTQNKLEFIIRRCGILDEYKDYFVPDPEIIINQFTLNFRKTFKYYNEFRNGVLIASEILT